MHQVRVGFVGGRFAKHEHYVLPIDECENISDQMKSIVRDFEQFVIDSGQIDTLIWSLLLFSIVSNSFSGCKRLCAWIAQLGYSIARITKTPFYSSPVDCINPSFLEFSRYFCQQ